METKKGPTSPPIPNSVWRSCIQNPYSPLKTFIVQILQTTFIIIQHAEPTNRVIVKLKKDKEETDNIKLIPPTIVDPVRIWWRVYLSTRYFAIIPPTI